MFAKLSALFTRIVYCKHVFVRKILKAEVRVKPVIFTLSYQRNSENSRTLELPSTRISSGAHVKRCDEVGIVILKFYLPPCSTTIQMYSLLSNQYFAKNLGKFDLGFLIQASKHFQAAAIGLRQHHL